MSIDLQHNEEKKESNRMIEIWSLGIGEPLVISGDNVRLRRLGNFSYYISEDNSINYRYFSISFDHYKKTQLTEHDEVFEIKPNYYIHVSHVPGYKKNISLERVITHYCGAKKIRQEMEQIEKKPDVIFCMNQPLELIKEASTFASKHDIPLIIDVRDLWPDVFKDSVPSKYRNIINIYVEYCRKSIKKSLKEAVSFIGLSKSFLNYELDLAGRKRTDLDVVIPIGYPSYNYNYTKVQFNELWNRYGLKNSDYIIVFAGNFGRQFQFEPIIDASHILDGYSDIKFVLCGTGEQLDTVKAKCADNVVFPGWIEKDMIVSLLQFSKIGIAPYINSYNYRQNTPNKFGEYLSASLPILVSVDGIMNDYLTENSCGSCYSDGKDLAKKIMDIKTSQNYELMSSAARNLYENVFDVKIMNESLKKHMIKIANNKGMK